MSVKAIAKDAVLLEALPFLSKKRPLHEAVVGELAQQTISSTDPHFQGSPSSSSQALDRSPLSQRKVLRLSSSNPKQPLLARRLFPAPLASQDTSLVSLCKNRIRSLQTDQRQARNLLSQILSSSSPEVELSLFLYYLERDQHLPTLTDTLAEYRIQEMLTYIRSLEEESSFLPSKAKEALPLSITQYILRAFCRMLVSPSGFFNADATSVIKLLLHSALASYLTPEHCQHMLHVVQDIASHPLVYQTELSTVLNGSFRVHAELVNHIRLDWQIASHHPITPQRTAWVLVKSMLDYYPQYPTHSTCSMTVAINTIGTALPYKRLQVLMRLLQTNSVKIKDLTFPLAHLTSCYLVEEELTHTEVNPDVVLDVTALSRVYEVTGSIPPQKQVSKTASSRELKDCFDEETRTEALQLLTFLNRNALLNLLCVAAQVTNHHAPSPVISDRDRYLADLVKALKKSGISFSEEAMIKHLSRFIFLESLLIFKTKIRDALEEVSSDGRQFYFIDTSGQRFSNLSFSKFSRLLSKILPDSRLSAWVLSDDFAECLYLTMLPHYQLDKFPLTLDMIRTNDVFVLPFNGNSSTVIRHLFRTSILEHTVNGSTPKYFLLSLHEKIRQSPAVSAIIKFDDHSCILQSDELLSLSRRHLKKILRQQANVAVHPDNILVAPLSLADWRMICSVPSLTTLDPKNVYTALSVLKKPQHPYVLASQFYRFCLQHDIYDYSLFDCYRRICDCVNCAVAIPFADLNWRTSLNPDVSASDKIALSYNRSKDRYEFKILNQSTGLSEYPGAQFDSATLCYLVNPRPGPFPAS
ncbi:MAG: hypothetical protein JSS62_05105 [Verrucomicrobia bacterium]|nr:hypothetical protein [Verrucomicrobiota bacterium]MBS0647474.1 hypothetical protein [Verrucomicrobiota bacterium]